MKKITVVLVLFCLWLSGINAQSIIHGIVDSKILNGGHVYVEVHHTYLLPFHNSFAEIHKYDMERDGKFHVVANLPNAYAYINVRYVDSVGKSYFLFKNTNLLLVRDGIDVSVKINEGGIELSDNEDFLIKLQVQFAAIWPESKTFGRMDKAAYAWKYESLMNCLDSLRFIHDSVEEAEPELKRVLLLNYQSFQAVGFIKFLSRRSFSDQGDIIDTSAFMTLQKSLKNVPKKMMKDVDTKYAYNYVDFIKNYVVNDLKAGGVIWNESEGGKQLLNRLYTTYSGYMRDQLLMSFYFDYLKRHDGCFTEELQSIKVKTEDSLFTEIISRVDSSQTQGAYAYPFGFQDSEGNILRLEDFRGDVLILEFWFNGCQPCAILSEHIKEFLKYYRHKEKIRLITINVDKNKEHWLSGVTSGKYTSDASIDLHVGEQGYFHEMLRQYNYVGFPQLMLIDKKGKLITAFAPRPITREGKEAFRKLLDKNI